jgi:hypothetical protein
MPARASISRALARSSLDLLGGGAVIDRGATATLTLGAGNFLGNDLGPAVARPKRQRVADRCPDLAPSGLRHSAAARVRSCCLCFLARRDRAEGRREIRAKALKSLISRKDNEGPGLPFGGLGEDFRAKAAFYLAISALFRPQTQRFPRLDSALGGEPVSSIARETWEIWTRR